MVGCALGGWGLDSQGRSDDVGGGETWWWTEEGEGYVCDAQSTAKQKADGVGTGVRYLSALVGPHGHIPVSTPRKSRVHARAECRLALFAVAAAPVGDVEG